MEGGASSMLFSAGYVACFLWDEISLKVGQNYTASVGTILAYIFYWLFVIGALVYMKWREVSSITHNARNAYDEAGESGDIRLRIASREDKESEKRGSAITA